MTPHDEYVVGAVIMVDGGFRVRLFYLDGRSADHIGEPLLTAEAAADALAAVLRGTPSRPAVLH